MLTPRSVLTPRSCTSSVQGLIPVIMVALMNVVALCGFLMLTAPSKAAVSPGSSGDGTLIIGAFNVQVFGLTKMTKTSVVPILIKILSRYDLVLIQEIRDSTETAIVALVDILNKKNEDQYEVVVSDRLGRSSSKEQYAFIYKPAKLTLQSSYVYDDSKADAFEREPFVAYFESPTTAVDRFAMIGVHIKPSQAREEIEELVGVYEDYVNRFGNKNAIIAGDMNADCSYLSKTARSGLSLKTDERFSWIISDELDTTVAKSDCSYDKFVIAGDELRDNIVTQRTGVFNFEETFDLDKELAEDVSDHYPIEMAIQGNLTPIQPFSTTTPDSLSCSGSFRAMVWMCKLVVGEQADMPVCIHRVVKSLVGYVDRCTDDWIKLFMSYPKV